MDPVQVNFCIQNLISCTLHNQVLCYSHVRNISYHQRAAFLEEDDEMEGAHSVAASAGDTDVSASKQFILI